MLNQICNPDRCLELYYIRDDQKPEAPAPYKDYIVGQNVSWTLRIKGSQTVQIRDLIVFGKLQIITDSKEGEKATIKARYEFTPGELNLKKINLVSTIAIQPQNLTCFRQELRDIVRLKAKADIDDLHDLPSLKEI